MTYPGDPALAQEIRDRVLTTFRQTLELSEEGRLQEASLGCDFILKMDPRFEPARKLQARLQSSAGPVAAQDLDPANAPISPAAQPPVAAAPSLSEDLRTVQFSPQDLSLTLADDGVDVSEMFGSLEQPTPPPMPPTRQSASATGGASSRIDELLDEGQRAFDQGQYQNAVDAWSRIFLIDLDNAEANRRIEAARKLKAEKERVHDELFHEGQRAFEEGRTDEAREILERLLDQNPDHLAARDTLSRLSEISEVLPPSAEHGDLYTEPATTPLPATFERAPAAAATPLASARSGPPPGRRTGPASVKGQAKVARGDRKMLLVGVAALLLVLAGGWFLRSNWRRLFPHTEEAPAPVQASAIDEALRLHTAGDVEGAIARLRRVPQVSPERGRAEELLAEWAAASAATKVDTVVDTAARDAERAALLDRARRYYEEHEYLRAAKSFRAAERLAPLDGAVVDLFADTKRQLVPIASQIEMFQQREWDRALPMLWRQHVDDEANRDVKRLLVDTLFNLGVEALREGNSARAVENLRDVVRLAPDDALAQRMLLFAERYPGTSRDLVYQIFASQLEYRS